MEKILCPFYMGYFSLSFKQLIIKNLRSNFSSSERVPSMDALVALSNLALGFACNLAFFEMYRSSLITLQEMWLYLQVFEHGLLFASTGTGRSLTSFIC